MGTLVVRAVRTLFAMSVLLRGVGELSRIEGGQMALAGFDLSDRDQRQAEVAQLQQHAVQRGLVEHGAVDDRDALVLAGEAQSVEPSGPSRVQVPLGADLVP